MHGISNIAFKPYQGISVSTRPDSTNGHNQEVIYPNEFNYGAGIAFKQNLIRLNREKIGFSGKATPEKFDSLAKIMYEDAQDHFDSIMETMKAVLSGVPGTLTGRVKAKASIKNKLLKYHGDSESIVSLPPLLINQEVPDLIELRLVLKTGTPGEVDAMVKALLKAFDKNKSKSFDDFILFNFYNHGECPYLTEEHCAELRKRRLKDNPQHASQSYITANFIIYTPQGKVVELQVRGPKVDKIANAEHPVYNFNTKGKASIREVVVPELDEALRVLSPEEKFLYDDYLKSLYEHSRNQELGIPKKAPAFPQNLNPVLSMESLKNIQSSASNK